jgi:O-acetylserine/cysteine efflux transporter
LRTKDVFLVLIMNLAFGASIISAKIGVIEFPAFLFTTLRFLIVAIVLIPFLKIHKGQMINILIISILGGGLHFGFFYLALDNSNYVSSVAIVLQLGIPISTILSAIFLKEIIRWRRILGIILSFAGVITLMFEPTIFSDLDGVYFALLAATAISISMIFMKKLDGIKVFDLQAWLALISALMLGIVSLTIETNHYEVIINASYLAWGAVIFTSLIATGIGHATFYYLITNYDVSKITPLTLIVPIFAIINSLIVTHFDLFDGFNESISIKIIIGAAMTLLGVGIVMIREKNIDVSPRL